MKKFLLLIAALALSACSDRQRTILGCEKNEECLAGFYCKKTAAAAGFCACEDNSACQAGEICNTQGICQAKNDCRANIDCETAQFCNLATGDCIDRVACGADVHCLPGQVCNLTSSVCQDGCFDNGDCPLYQVCEAGRCSAGKCGDKTFCAYGQFCNNGACVNATNPAFCRDCDPEAANSCDSGNNFCLINSSYDPNNPRSGGENFCGIDCSSANDCPNGYDCGGVVLLTQDQCTSNAECGGGGRVCAIGEGQLRGFCTCAGSTECNFNSAPPTCLKTCGGLGLLQCQNNNECPSGNCAPTACQWPQGQTCTQDAQCQPLEICLDQGLGTPGQKNCVTDGSPCNDASTCQCDRGRCLNSGRLCSTSADCVLSCVNGGCLLGSACAPIQGLLCPDVRP